jgi:hypothetical protein
MEKVPPSLASRTRKQQEGFMNKRYWIVGRDNPHQKPVIVVEIYDDDGNPIDMEFPSEIPAGIPHDTDSTDCFRNC